MTKQKTSSPLSYLSVLIVIASVSMPSVSQAALNAYLTLKCNGSDIMGDVEQSGREGSIEVYGFGHSIISPRDAASGLPTGKRQHRPVRVIKAIDSATPLLYNALFNNHTCTDVFLRFWRPTATGQEQQFYTIELENATISSVMPTMANNRVPENAAFPVLEVISFSYQKIIVTIEDGGITAEDDWRASP